MCIAAERGWQPRAGGRGAGAGDAALLRGADAARARLVLSLRQPRRPGAREWKSELSSIDTALLLAGVLTVRRCFADDPDVVRYADVIYRRVDFRWMLAGHPTLLAHGWRPESGFLEARWDRYCELMILYLLGHRIADAPDPRRVVAGLVAPDDDVPTFTYVSWSDPLFVHQYSHAWIDFRGRRERRDGGVDWFENSVAATRAHKAFCLSLARGVPRLHRPRLGHHGVRQPQGLHRLGRPAAHPGDRRHRRSRRRRRLADVRAGHHGAGAARRCTERFGDRIYGRYGFADAFHPTDGWVNPDVIGIDLGITLLSAENLRTGNVWRWFMQSPDVQRGMRLALGQ